MNILMFINCCVILRPYLHHFCSRGMGNARRSLNQRNHQRQTEQSPACWPTSLAAGVCPRPRPRAGCRGSYLETASECPYGSPSDTEVSLFEPFCSNSRQRPDVKSELLSFKEKIGHIVSEINDIFAERKRQIVASCCKWKKNTRRLKCNRLWLIY